MGGRSSKLKWLINKVSNGQAEDKISKSSYRDFNDEDYNRGEAVYKKASRVAESLLLPFKVSEEQTFFGDIQGETRDPENRKDPDYRVDVEAPEPKQKKRRKERKEL